MYFTGERENLINIPHMTYDKQRRQNSKEANSLPSLGSTALRLRFFNLWSIRELTKKQGKVKNQVQRILSDDISCFARRKKKGTTRGQA